MSPEMSDVQLKENFERFGAVSSCVVDRILGRCLVTYEEVSCAHQAVVETKSGPVEECRVQV